MPRPVSYIICECCPTLWYGGRVAEIVSERRDSSTARVPSVPVGTALVFTRYDEEKAVVLNPQDFHRLRALDRDLEEISSDRPPLSELALEAHALEDTPGTPSKTPTRSGRCSDCERPAQRQPVRQRSLGCRPVCACTAVSATRGTSSEPIVVADAEP